MSVGWRDGPGDGWPSRRDQRPVAGTRQGESGLCPASVTGSAGSEAV